MYRGFSAWYIAYVCVVSLDDEKRYFVLDCLVARALNCAITWSTLVHRLPRREVWTHARLVHRLPLSIAVDLSSPIF